MDRSKGNGNSMGASASGSGVLELSYPLMLRQSQTDCWDFMEPGIIF